MEWERIGRGPNTPPPTIHHKHPSFPTIPNSGQELTVYNQEIIPSLPFHPRNLQVIKNGMGGRGSRKGEYRGWVYGGMVVPFSLPIPPLPLPPNITPNPSLSPFHPLPSFPSYHPSLSLHTVGSGLVRRGGKDCGELSVEG